MRFYTFIIYVLVVLLTGCSSDDYGDNIQFNVQVGEVGAYSAMTTVTHNANNRDSYYCFAVEGVVTDIQSEIAKHLSSVSPSQLAMEEHYQRKSVFRITRLFPEKTYTLIVFGMTKEQQLYGKPDMAVFTTTQNDIVATENPNWQIQYHGHTVYKDNDYSLITVSVKGEVEERYFLASMTVTELNAFHSTEELIAHATFTFLEKKEVDLDYWLEDSEVRTTGTYFYRYLMPDDYAFYAIGINPDGSPTGHYVKTPIFTIEKYPAEESYANLLGNWEIIGDECRYNVSFTEGKLNKSLYMSGWGNSPEYSIGVTYDRNDGSLTINSQLVSWDAKICFEDGDKYSGKLYLYGAYYDTKGELQKIGYKETVALAKASLNKDGTYTFKSKFYVKMEDGSNNYTTGIMYYIEQAKPYDWAMFDLMMFPFTMRKR